MSIIKIIKEKYMQNIRSKGRRQWGILKQFNNKNKEDFIEYAKALTKKKPSDEFQQGNWWDREIKWNLERDNIVIISNKKS